MMYVIIGIVIGIVIAVGFFIYKAKTKEEPKDPETEIHLINRNISVTNMGADAIVKWELNLNGLENKYVNGSTTPITLGTWLRSGLNEDYSVKFTEISHTGGALYFTHHGGYGGLENTLYISLTNSTGVGNAKVEVLVRKAGIDIERIEVILKTEVL